ncbi:MAG TPA: trypsin-like serine protease [Polyangiaceae bacterium]|nr:trypsin-like serine protease [Polyangiaceae bacterium]
MRVNSLVASVFVLASISAACGSGTLSAPDEILGTQSEAIFKGTVATTPFLRTGVERAVAKINGGGCTGTAIAADWVITARHCVNAAEEGVFVATISSHNVTFEGSQFMDMIVPPENVFFFTLDGSDTALLKLPRTLGASFPTAKLFTGQDANAVGKAVKTFGYGAFDKREDGLCATDSGKAQCAARSQGWGCNGDADCLRFDGQLRTANFKIDHIVKNGEMYGNPVFDGKFINAPPNASGQYTLPGDSGGPTFINDGSAFQDQLVGTLGGGDNRAYAKIFRDWVEGILINHTRGVLHPQYSLPFDWTSIQRASRKGDFAFGQWKAECGLGYVVSGLSVDQTDSQPGPRAALCSYSPEADGGNSTMIDFSVSDARRDTSSGEWAGGFLKGECAADEAITALSQTTTTPPAGTKAKQLSRALCTPLKRPPSAARSCVVVDAEGSTVGVENDGWAYNWGRTINGTPAPIGHYKAQCPDNYFMTGVSVSPSTGRPHSARCCYDFVPTDKQFVFADVTLGGADLITVQPDSFDVQVSQGTRFDVSREFLYGGYRGKVGPQFADVTGDGRADLIISTDTGLVVRRSSGASFGSPEVWTDVAFEGKYGLFFADVDNDRDADAIVSNDFGITVRRSNGSRFLANEAWTTNAFLGSHGTFFADVDNDGDADAIVSNDFGLTVRRSDKTKFLGNETWSDVAFLGTRGAFFADVDGDRRADAVVANDFGMTVRRSDGSRFTANEDWTSGPFIGEFGNFLADVTGDGKADAIVINSFGVTVRRSLGSSFGPNEDWHLGS